MNMAKAIVTVVFEGAEHDLDHVLQIWLVDALHTIIGYEGESGWIGDPAPILISASYYFEDEATALFPEVKEDDAN